MSVPVLPLSYACLACRGMGSLYIAGCPIPCPHCWATGRRPRPTFSTTTTTHSGARA